VDGPYISGYYTFDAKPGMKFINIQFRFTNVGVREQITPYLNAGEVVVAPQGYYYKVWSPPVGVHSIEYEPRPSTVDEVIALGGDAGAFEALLPGQSVTGSLVFEIPENVVPIEAQVQLLPVRFSFARGATSVPTLIPVSTSTPVPTATAMPTPTPTPVPTPQPTATPTTVPTPTLTPVPNDFAGPVVTSASVAPTEGTLQTTFSFTVTATDPSGVRLSHFYYQEAGRSGDQPTGGVLGPIGCLFQGSPMVGTCSTDVWAGSSGFSPNNLYGTYRFVRLMLWDDYDNHTIYYSDGIVAGAGWPPGSTHSLIVPDLVLSP